MATSFPSSLDSFTNPLSSDTLSSPSHAGQHTDLNDAVAALEAKVGVDSSAVTSSLDYKVAQLESDVAGFTSGKILQVVSTTKVDMFSTSSTSFVDITDMSLSITPSSTSSKILVMVMVTVGHSANGSNDHIRLVRDSTGIFITTAGSFATGTIEWNNQDAFSSNSAIPFPIIYLDSPASTSATTYKLQAQQSNGTLYINRSGAASNAGVSSITLMEVAA